MSPQPSIDAVMRENHALRQRLRHIEQAQEKGRKAVFIADAADQLLTLIDREYRYEIVNRAYCQARGQTPEVLLGRSVQAVWGQKPFERSIQPCLERCFAGQVATHEDWFAFDGQKERCFQVTYHPYRAVDDQVTHAIVVTHDITAIKSAQAELLKAHDRLERSVHLRTAALESANLQLRREIDERRRAVAALQESENRYRSVSRDMPAMVCRHLPDGRLTFANRRFCQYHQISADNLDSVRIQDFFSRAEGKKRQARLARLGPQGPMVTYEQAIRDATGATIWRQWTDRALFDDQGRPLEYQSVSIDITEKKRVEHQLQQAQKMEAIGTLAGGIAHDFNNLLMGIQGNVSLMGLEIEKNHALRTPIANIEALVERAANLTRQLLGFARGGKYVVKPVEINDLVAKTATLFGRTRSALRIHQRYARPAGRVAADQGQMEQMLVNLYLNAWQAMAPAGDLYLETRNLTIDERFVKPFEIRYGDYVRIAVTDTGPGIDPAIADRIFDPFFTTRGFGQGSGLGLASVFGIVKNHGGFVDFQSRPGQGTTFHVYLPVCSQPVQRPETPPDDILTGVETVLLVDDEPYVLQVGVKMLEKMGHTVLPVDCGQAAVDLFSDQHRQIDLVILDLILPDMDGKEVFEQLRAIDPGAKVLLASGYHPGEEDPRFAGRCDGFIQKPFRIEALSHALRKVIDSNRT